MAVEPPGQAEQPAEVHPVRQRIGRGAFGQSARDDPVGGAVGGRVEEYHQRDGTHLRGQLGRRRTLVDDFHLTWVNREAQPLGGDSPERVEAAEPERARGADEPEPPQPEAESELARVLPPADNGTRRAPETTTPRLRGSLGDALKNLQQYVQNETFDNPQGGNDRPGAQIQFDTRGVEFGPWLRRFVAQVRRNWFIPQAALVLSGHVVLQFNIHRSGEITDLVVLRPSAVDAFTHAAYGAIVSSNPTAPLPPEYPLDKALFSYLSSRERLLRVR